MQLKLLLLLLLSSLMGFSQTDSTLNNNSNRKFELSLNVTTSISNFFGNSNSNSLLADPYLIGIKYQLKPNYYLRFGANIKSRKVTENFGQRNVVENNEQLRIGVEKRIAVTSKIFFYPGFDLVGGYFYSDVQTFDGISNTQIQAKQITIGGGPMIGILYQINQRLAISTEAALYYQNLTTQRYMSLGFPDPTPIKRTEHGYTVLPIIPSSIYFTIKL